MRACIMQRLRNILRHAPPYLGEFPLYSLYGEHDGYKCLYDRFTLFLCVMGTLSNDFPILVRKRNLPSLLLSQSLDIQCVVVSLFIFHFCSSMAP